MQQFPGETEGAGVATKGLPPLPSGSDQMLSGHGSGALPKGQSLAPQGPQRGTLSHWIDGKIGVFMREFYRNILIFVGLYPFGGDH